MQIPLPPGYQSLVPFDRDKHRNAGIAEAKRGPFAAGLLDRHPDWSSDLDEHYPPGAAELATEITHHGLASLGRNQNLITQGRGVAAERHSSLVACGS